MSKAMKKMMKEKEEKRLMELNNDYLNSEKIVSKPKINCFNKFGGNNNFSENISSDSESEPENTPKEEIPIPNKKKNKKKKNKNKKNKPKKEKEEEQLNQFFYQKDSDINKEDENKKSSLFLYLKTFNYNKELDSYFKGSRLVDKQDHSGYTKNQLKQFKQFQKMNRPNKKYNLIHNEDILYKLPNKLDMLKLKTNKNGVNVFIYNPPIKFKKVEEAYNMVKNSNNPQLMFDFYQENPNYPLILYDVGEYYRLNNNIKEANILLEKLIFLYEDSLVYEFKIFDNNCNDKNIIDFYYNEYCKTFFKSLLKFIIILTKKSCFKSALEYNKFLFKLNPFEDPMGSLIMMDHLANFASRFDWLLNFVEKYPKEYSPYYKNYNSKIDYSLILYPNYIFSIAFAKFSLKLNSCSIDKEYDELYKIDKNEIEYIKNFDISMNKSCNFFLLLGMILYPNLIKNLINESQLKKIIMKKSYFNDYQKRNIDELMDHDSMKNSEEYLYSFLNLVDDEDSKGVNKVIEIYPERNKVLWKTKEVATWIQSNLGYLVEKMENKNFNKEKFINECICPENQNSQILTDKYMIPFSPKIHKDLLSKDFSDNDQHIDMNNINEAEQIQINQGNLDMNQNPFSLFLNSLLPGTILPNQDNINGNNNIDDNQNN